MARQCTPPAFLEQKYSTPALGHTREPESKGPVTGVKKELPMSVSPSFSWHLRNADFAVSALLCLHPRVQGLGGPLGFSKASKNNALTEKATNNHC